MPEEKNAREESEKSGFGLDLLNRVAVGIAGVASGSLATSGYAANMERVIETVPGNALQWAAVGAGAAAMTLAAMGSMRK